MHRLLIGILLMIVTTGLSQAWTIGAKGHVNGPSIHTTYFLTPNNQSFAVTAQAYMGSWVNGSCQPSSPLYNIGAENLRTGDVIDIDAYQLKAVMGGGYSCMVIYYNQKQSVNETIQLTWDGYNYSSSTPGQSEIQLL